MSYTSPKLEKSPDHFWPAPSGAAMSDARPPRERRVARRKKPRGKLTLELRKGTLGLGQNLAIALQDLSETGACLVAKPGLALKDEVELKLSSTTLVRPIKLVGVVVRVAAINSHEASIGVRFHKQVTYNDLNNLT